jgi:hypothetical protein
MTKPEIVTKERRLKAVNPRKTSRFKVLLLVSLSILFVSFAISAAQVSFASASSEITTTTTTYSSTSPPSLLTGCGSLLSACYPLKSSVVQWSVNFGSSPSTSHFTLTVQASGSSAPILKSVQVSTWMTFDGAKYWTSSFSLSYLLLQTSASKTFTVPFVNGGEYVFYATFTSNGKVVAQQIVDPKIEPNW